MINILFAAKSEQWDHYDAPLRVALDATCLDYTLSTDLPADSVDYIVYAPNSDVQDFTPFTRLRAVLNLWAGVEDVVHNPTLHAPLARMVDPAGLTQGMVEWVTGHVLRHHLGMDLDILRTDRQWQVHHAPLAADRPVTILGFGALGQACAAALMGLGFPVSAWARSMKPADDIPAGVSYFHGQDSLPAALAGAQIVVLLLPSTAQTADIINAQTMQALPKGAVIINPGRGALIDEDALLAAIETGQISHATLDTFKTEPLPADHPFWANPHITVTPHIASVTRPKTAAQVIAQNIARDQRGEALLHLVDRAASY